MITLSNKILLTVLLENRLYIKEHIPTKREVLIIEYIKKNGPTNSTDYSRAIGVSIQLAGMRMKTAYEKGYLEREEKFDPSGGIYHEYTYAL